MTLPGIPDRVFREAEELAHRLRMSRSELYSRAVREYLDAHGGNRIRETLDRVYSVEDSSIDPGFVEAQIDALPDEAW